jgi:hypothetical protein
MKINTNGGRRTAADAGVNEGGADRLGEEREERKKEKREGGRSR